MDLLHPTRITSLNPIDVRVIVHTSATTTENITIKKVYPFETLYTFKQRISLHFGSKNKDGTWLPEYLYIAQQHSAKEYESLEFFWAFSKTLADPFSYGGKTDNRIYDKNARKPIFPTILSGITAETAFTSDEIHVWKLTDIAEAAGFGQRTPIPEASYQGFFSLYFPLITDYEIVKNIFKRKDYSDAYESASLYREEIDARLDLVAAGLLAPSVINAKPVNLRELRLLRYILPQKSDLLENSLELRFYEMTPSPSIPFMRFFPAYERSKPLIKLATNAAGHPIISNPQILDQFMADEPSSKNGAVIVLKAPIVVKNAAKQANIPIGAAWTIKIYHDGSADIKIGAPRKDTPLVRNVIEYAFNLLPAVLDETYWGSEILPDLQLAEFTGIFDFKSTMVEKPSKMELKRRLDAFLPFFNEERLPEKSKVNMMLRYKAVSNFDESVNPISTHISNLFLRDGNLSLANISTDDYVASIVRNFGIPPETAVKEIQNWITLHEETIRTDKEAFLSSLNLGTAVSISSNNHPNYSFFLSGTKSITDLQRIVSLLTVFTSLPSDDLVVKKHTEDVEELFAEMEASVPVPHAAIPDEYEDDDIYLHQMDAFGDFGDFGDFGVSNAADVADAADAADAADIVVKNRTPTIPDVLKENERIQPMSTGWFLERLESANTGLFKYFIPKDDMRIGTYSVKCQTAKKQPFVMTPENYSRARNIYNTDVFWVEAPFDDTTDLQALSLANKTVEQRRSYAIKDLGKTTEDIKAMEIRALELGFALKGDQSFTEKDPKSTAEEIANIKRLIQEQKTKPLWTVIRAGSVLEKPNYYMCGIYWCIRDDLPLIPSEFAGKVLRNGKPKAADSCPFCGGVLIKNIKNPAIGETVFKRETASKGTDTVAQYIGYPKDVFHPEGFPLPCCFVDFDNLLVPPTTQKMPPPLVPLPANQIKMTQTFDADIIDDIEEDEEETEAEEIKTRVDPMDDINKSRPFSIKSMRGSSQNKWYIPNQNVMGRIATEWFELKRGEIGIPPPSVNKLLGQIPANFLTANKGALGQSINSYLKPNTSAFVRYSVGSTGILGLIAFAEYASACLTMSPNAVKIRTVDEIYDYLFVEKEYAMAHAFEQANYGTLMHEFSVGNRKISTSAFQTWCGKMGIPLPDQHVYAEKLYKAWLNFKDYMRNDTQVKDLRLFEGLFSTAGLMTLTGFIIAKINIPKSPSDPAVIECPKFGISYSQQYNKPPLMFVIYDELTGNFDPLVLYDNTAKKDTRLMGLIHHDAYIFGELPAQIKEPLAAFMIQYFSPFEGCGRTAEPIHPWIPEMTTTLVPKLYELSSRLKALELKMTALVRDRSNRLVGCIVRSRRMVSSAPQIYIPVIDDGLILPFITSLRGETVIPRPSLKVVLDTLIGTRYPPAEGKLASSINFPGLLPVRIVHDTKFYNSVELRCGALIPFNPIPVNRPIPHDRFAQMVDSGIVEIDIRRDYPWDDDVILLGATSQDYEEPEQTDEEVLNEAYQHLRISFAHWLNNTEAGADIKQQIEELRQARIRLPLWELRKRLDILLLPVINSQVDPWFTTEGKTTKSMLRRNCLQIKTKSSCLGGCSWSSDKCLIHTTGTQRYIDPIRVLTARLVDELLRTFGAAMEILRNTVSHLRSLDESSVIKEGRAILFATEGRGSEALYEKLGYSGRKPSIYTKGLTYPEEVGVDIDVGDNPAIPESWATSLQQAHFGADIARDKLATLEATLVILTGSTIQEIEKILGKESITGSDEDWVAIAAMLNVDVLITGYNSMTHKTEIIAWISIDSDNRDINTEYIVLDLFGIPLQRIKTGDFTIPEKALPVSIRMWLDSHTPAVKLEPTPTPTPTN